MKNKIKIAVNWAASCGGCDVSLLDIEEPLLDLAAIAEIVYWPVAMDFKEDDFLSLPEGSVDFGLYNGSVRTSDHEKMAFAFREKCKVLVAYGSCACFGGVIGLANLSNKEQIFEVAYQTTPSTENEKAVRPMTETTINGYQLTLPSFLESVRSLSQVVDVDIFLPGCPPPTERIMDLVKAVSNSVETGALPPPGTVIASEKALCDECARNANRRANRIAEVYRPHEKTIDPTLCFIDQGMICMGLATRAGCGATCLNANMPCRGCFGPLKDALDPGSSAISVYGSIAGRANENDIEAHIMKKTVRDIRDPVGMFYRFTLPVAFVNRAVEDIPKKEKP